MPSGRLRPGLEKVAGVVPVEVRDALVELQRTRGLPSMSRAVGEALTEWWASRADAVLNPGPRPTALAGPGPDGGVLNPRDARRDGLAR
jgi:hypothetical protein